MRILIVGDEDDPEITVEQFEEWLKANLPSEAFTVKTPELVILHAPYDLDPSVHKLISGGTVGTGRGYYYASHVDLNWEAKVTMVGNPEEEP